MNNFYPATSVLSAFAFYVPQLITGAFLLVVGLLLAKMVRHLLEKLSAVLLRSSVIANTPIEHFLKNANLADRIDRIVGSLGYWFTVIITVYVVSATVGLSSISHLLEQLFGYLPRFLSAMVVFLLGLVLAGFVESLTKSSLVRSNPRLSRLVGKASSYFVLVVTGLIVLSELGIARDFVLILFVGLTLSISIGVGLALGLGGQHLVKELLFKVAGDSQMLSSLKKVKK